MEKILNITKKLNIPDDYVIPYGHYIAKIDYSYYDKIKDNPDGKYILITSALNANAAGEGKTSTEIGLNDALNFIGVKSIACLREPSQGVSYGNKGPAHGALKAQIVPDEVDYHFTGDIHALTYTINSIAAEIDNIIYQGNSLNIDPNKIVWNRAIDICDRSLRSVTVAQDDKKAIPHHCEFVITVAHELSTIMMLAKDEDDFLAKTKKAIVAYTYDNKLITVGDLHMSKAIEKMMHNALQPNIVQSLEGNPVFVHGVPFANISCGTNSVMATKLAQKLADIVLVESGFGSDLGGEKNLNLVCPKADIKPAAIVAVCSCRSLKLHGGENKENLDHENINAVRAGLINLSAHLRHLKQYNVPIVIAINKFIFDTEAELKVITDYLDENKIIYEFSEAPLKGSAGSVMLANKVLQAAFTENNYTPLYEFTDTIEDKIYKICTKVYGAKNVEYTESARKQLDELEHSEYKNLPICISKTPASITDDPSILGAPTDFTIHIRELRLYAGAGFIIVLSGGLLMLPGLGKVPRLSDNYFK